MVSIYKITNDVNDIVYVGKTHHSLKQRFLWHISDATKETETHRKLYNAMSTIGVEHFSIAQIEQCDDTEGAQRESYWINKFKNACGVYNETLGGDGKQYYDHEEILKALERNPYYGEVAKEIGCCVDVVREVGRKNGIQSRHRGREMAKLRSVKVNQYDADGCLLRTFSSMAEAFLWCCNNGCARSNPKGSGTSHISDAAKGKKKTAYGYQWRYANSN